MKGIILLSVFYIGLGFSNILEVSSIASMNKYKEKGVLFLYDLDNTLIQPVQMFGSDQWFFHRYKQLENEGIDKSKALEVVLCEWIAVQYATEVKEVEVGADKVIIDQQNNGIMLMGFTTRDHCLSKCTKKQLQALNIDFLKTAPLKSKTFIHEGNHILYENGVLYTAGTHKGKALFAFLKEAKVYPIGVVFINDKRAHLDQVEEVCKQRGIPFVGLRYNYLDKQVKAFNPKIAKRQRDKFFAIPSDKVYLADIK